MTAVLSPQEVRLTGPTYRGLTNDIWETRSLMGEDTDNDTFTQPEQDNDQEEDSDETTA